MLVNSATDQGAFLFEKGQNYFFVPHNIYIIGTMNVIDRSVEAFDFALRRRFRWIELKFDKMALRQILHTWDDSELDELIGSFEELNSAIAEEAYLGPDYRIGHAYAKFILDYSGAGGTNSALNFLWWNHLEPLLKEYLRGRGRADAVQEKIEAFRGKFMGD